MGTLTHWLTEHRFARDDVESREKLRSTWETILLVILAVAFILTMVSVFAPNFAAIILSHIL